MPEPKIREIDSYGVVIYMRGVKPTHRIHWRAVVAALAVWVGIAAACLLFGLLGFLWGRAL